MKIRKLFYSFVSRVQKEAVRLLQESSEATLVELFENANKCTVHAKRVTLLKEDLILAIYIYSFVAFKTNKR